METISKIKRWISTKTGVSPASMTLVETVDCNGKRLRYEWGKDNKKLEKVTDGDGTSAVRLSEHVWQIIDVASGTEEYQFKGDIKVSKNGSLTVEQDEGTSTQSESVTLSLNGEVTRTVNIARNERVTAKFRQWSGLNHSRLTIRYQIWYQRQNEGKVGF